MKVGLALSGGGSLGAYEAGAIQALAELDIKIDAIAGTSIGALNGAVLASGKDLTSGSAKLVQLWRNLAEEDILQANITGLLTLLASLGLPLSTVAVWLGDAVPETGLYSSEPIKNCLKKLLNHRILMLAPLFM